MQGSHYNKDFSVALNMIKSDYHGIVECWFKGEDAEPKYTELAVNWLNDKDNPFGSEKSMGIFQQQGLSIL